MSRWICTRTWTRIRSWTCTRTSTHASTRTCIWNCTLATAMGVVAALGVGGCMAHSSYQSARIAEPGKQHVTLAAGRTTVQETGRSDTRWWNAEIMTRHALSPAADMGFKMSFMKEEEFGSLTTALDWKMALVRDHLAANLGVGMVVPVFQSAYVFPGVIATLPLTRHVDVNAAAKLVFMPTATSPQPMHAYNVGLALELGSSGFIVRPEIAVLEPRDGNAKWVQFGVGIDFPHAPPRGTR